MIFKRGIRLELITSIVVLTLFAVTTIGFMGLTTVENASVFRKAKEAESIAKLVKFLITKADLTDSLANANDPMVYELENVLSSVGIYDVVLRDDRGEVLMSRGKIFGEHFGEPVQSDIVDTPKGEVIIDSNGIVVTAVNGEGVSSFFQGPAKHLLVSITDKSNNKKLNRIIFTISLSDIAIDSKYLRSLFLILAIVDALVIIAIGLVRLNISVMRPLKKLESAAIRISGGAYGDRAVLTVQNEFGSLAKSFNTMAEKLESEIKRLERVNTELVTTQDELLRSSILASMGRLAAGIAHEIGNPLGAVSGYIEILEKGVKDKTEEKDILKRAATELARINIIVREFLDVSRPGGATGPVDAVHLNSLLEEVSQTMSYDASFADISMELVLSDRLKAVRIDEGKLRQVIINLLKNSSDAMEGRGTITLSTGLEDVLEEHIGNVGRRKGDTYIDSDKIKDPYHKIYCYIAVHDDGCGMDSEIAKNIFEPFYTTKATGKGTGLGLFMAQTIVKAYGGKIEVMSEVGSGTEFKVYLPVVSEFGRGNRASDKPDG